MEALLGRILDNEVEGAVNLRDLGGYGTDAGRVRSGVLYRSAVTHNMSEQGLRVLASQLGIRTVFDLRNDHEIAQDGVAPFAMHGIAYRNYAISGATILTPDQQRERMLAIRDGLVSWPDLYFQMLETGSQAFRSMLLELAHNDSAPALFHCTGGRDRTGMAALLILGLLGVSDEDIAHDYSLTGDALLPHGHLFHRNLAEMEMTREQWDRMVATTPEPIHAVLSYLREAHGGVSGYLEGIGVDARAQSALREKLIA